MADREHVTTALERDLRESRRIINELVRENRRLKALLEVGWDPDEIGVTTSDDNGVW